MFFNVNKLNEGKGKNNFPNVKSDELKEGKNPKISFDSCSYNWLGKDIHCLTNRNWEKLRK